MKTRVGPISDEAAAAWRRLLMRDGGMMAFKVETLERSVEPDGELLPTTRAAMRALLRLARATEKFRRAQENAVLAAVMSAHTDSPFDAEAFAIKERDARREMCKALIAFDFGEERSGE